ncbi:MAG: YdeI/OmpD-associated family protein [Bacteroidota bacterium]
MPVEITEIFYPTSRSDWRNWLSQNHDKKEVIWVKMYKKATGKYSIPYDDLVEECLCFGWIDGVVKKTEPESRVQRITPRRKKSFLSELNRQRVWKLRKLGLMMSSGESALEGKLGSPDDELLIPDFVEKALKEDPNVWETFKQFPLFYQKLKVGWIVETGLTKSRMPEAEKRLAYLVKMTEKGKRYGSYPMEGLDGEN